MDAITKVHNEETRLVSARTLQYSSVLVVGLPSSWSTPPPPVLSSTTPPSSTAPSSTSGEDKGLLCNHCGRSGPVEAFCYRKKKELKAQARHSSQGTTSTTIGCS